MTERSKRASDTIAVVLAEIMGLCDVHASDDKPISVKFGTLLRWHDQLEGCLHPLGVAQPVPALPRISEGTLDNILSKLDQGAEYQGYPEGFGFSWTGLCRDAATIIRRLRAAQPPAAPVETEDWRDCFKYIDQCDWVFLEDLLAKSKRHAEDSQTGIWIEVIGQLKALASAKQVSRSSAETSGQEG